jgi:RHS repeat-associated protein
MDTPSVVSRIAWRSCAGAIREKRPRQDAEHYNYFRDYDPAIGRYLESDPIGLRGGRDTYGYVRASPLRLLDRFGLRAQMCCKFVIPPFAHCFINEEKDEAQSCSNCTSQTRRIGLQGPAPWGSSTNGAGEIHTNDPFDQPGESQCGGWVSYCGLSKCLDQTKDDYPSRSEYRAIAGPNSNTFATHMANMCSIPFATGLFNAPAWNQPPAGPAK